MKMAQTVFTANGFPKVGIRPIIDGRRRGVRESLEDQTMDMAKAAAKLISDNLKYPDGTPVQCVISDTTIGGRFEAAMCANKFRDNNVGVSLSVTPCWCYGTETMDLDPQIPKAVWGFNGTERPGAVYLACPPMASMAMKSRTVTKATRSLWTSRRRSFASPRRVLPSR